MRINSKTQLVGLFGNPSRHSLSPLIQNYFLKSYGLNAVYLSFEPGPESLADAFNGARNLNFIGLNVTMPFKEQICELLDGTEGAAKIIKSVNTVKFFQNTGSSIGYSTDGEGLVKSLEDKGFLWNEKKCFIIGAGGAARSAAYSLFEKPLEKIYIFDIEYDRSLELLNTITANILRLQDEQLVNRESKKIKNGAIINEYKNIPGKKPGSIKLKVGSKIKKIYSKNVSGVLDAIDKKFTILTYINEIEKELGSIDLIINCTPAGMDLGNGSGNIEKCPVPNSWSLKDKFIFDMVYKPVETVFIKKALNEGAAAIIPGTDMLINQAAYSFKTWFNTMPEKNIINEVKNIVKDEITVKIS